MRARPAQYNGHVGGLSQVLLPGLCDQGQGVYPAGGLAVHCPDWY